MPRKAEAASRLDVYAFYQQRNRERRRRRRESDRVRRHSAQAVAARAAELDAARARVTARHAEMLRNPLATASLWQFIASQAKAGDRDAKLLWRAECEPLWAETRQKQFAARQEQVRRRRTEGFQRPGGPVGGNKAYCRGPTVYRGLVSDEHPILKLFVTKTRRAPALMVGDDKAQVWHCDSKLLGLDSAYVVANQDMPGVLRVELDRNFAGLPELRAAIIGCRVRLPNLVSCHADPAGRLLHPHLIWLLADSVCGKGKGRKAPQQRLDLTLAGLTAKLLPIGADPGGLSNRMRMKNPLSPLWSRFVLAETPYCLSPDPRPNAEDLPALSPCIDFPDVRARLREAAAAREGRPVLPDHPDPEVAGQSNALFRHLQAEARRRVGWFREQGNGSEAEFLAELTGEALRISPGSRAGEKAAAATARSVAGWTWAKYRPRPARTRCGTPEDRQERKAEGGRGTAAARSAASLADVAEGIQRLRRAGRRPTQAAVAAATGRGERTVRRHWQAALGAAEKPAIRSAIDKKVRVPVPPPPARVVGAVHGVPEVHQAPEQSALWRVAQAACGPSGTPGGGGPRSCRPPPGRPPQAEARGNPSPDPEDRGPSPRSGREAASAAGRAGSPPSDFFSRRQPFSAGGRSGTWLPRPRRDDGGGYGRG